jgi:ATP-dependent 26S proteasome regulatory subunit
VSSTVVEPLYVEPPPAVCAHARAYDPGVDELAKLLATRRDARVAVIGPQDAVSKYIGETEKNLSRQFDASEQAGAILFFDESDGLFGKREEVEQHDGPVVLGVRSIRSVPPELRTNLVVVRAPRATA